MRTRLVCTALAACLAALGAGCDKHGGDAAAAAPKPAEQPGPVVVVPAGSAAQAEQPAAGDESTCSGATEGGGECSGGCDQWDKAAGEVARRPIPAGSVWEEIPVAGMTCGGCERRVIANLGQLEGIVAVEADAELGQVRVAMAPGKSVRAAAVERINSLGYQAK